MNYSENIISRARSVRQQDEYQGRALINSALLEITLDTARKMVEHYAALASQHTEGPKRTLRIMRDMRTKWRATAKQVKAAYDDHPINERHLYVVLAAHHNRLAQNYTKLFDVYLTPEDHQLLHAAPVGKSKPVILAVLSHY
jgi:hypothetical protein